MLRLSRHGQGLALITGDAGLPVLRRLLRSGHNLQAQVLVLPHHGSDRSFLPAFYAAVQPRVLLAACGFQNRYGYPGPRLRAWAEKAGIPLLNTGTSGQITLRWPPEGESNAKGPEAPGLPRLGTVRP